MPWIQNTAACATAQDWYVEKVELLSLQLQHGLHIRNVKDALQVIVQLFQSIFVSWPWAAAARIEPATCSLAIASFVGQVDSLVPVISVDAQGQARRWELTVGTPTRSDGLWRSSVSRGRIGQAWRPVYDIEDQKHAGKGYQEQVIHSGPVIHFGTFHFRITQTFLQKISPVVFLLFAPGLGLLVCQFSHPVPLEAGFLFAP